jgi:hypothetical protein
MFDILKEMPWVTAILIVAWLPVIFVTLKHVVSRKDITMSGKIIWIIIGLIPLIGLLIYGFIQYRKTKIIVWLTMLALIISVSTIWFFIFYQPSISKRDVTKESALTLSVTDLLKEFQANEEQANTKYTNKVIEVSGTVEKVLTDESGTVIFLKSELEGTSVSGRLKAKQNVKENSAITLKGILTGYILGQIQLNEAVITKGETINPVAPNAAVITDTAVKTTTDSIMQKAKPDIIYKSNKGQIKFVSVTPVEEIEALNNQVISTLNANNGTVNFAALIKGFLFENELMQKHFNEDKYLHSDKYPKSNFVGKIVNINEVSFNKNGKYTVKAEGDLTIKGITKKIVANGTVQIENKTIQLNSVLKLRIKDFGIESDDIAEQIDIIISSTYTK